MLSWLVARYSKVEIGVVAAGAQGLGYFDLRSC